MFLQVGVVHAYRGVDPKTLASLSKHRVKSG
jgi:hypothetical protein